jgi:hypothetical protein
MPHVPDTVPGSLRRPEQPVDRAGFPRDACGLAPLSRRPLPSASLWSYPISRLWRMFLEHAGAAGGVELAGRILVFLLYQKGRDSMGRGKARFPSIPSALALMFEKPTLSLPARRLASPETRQRRRWLAMEIWREDINAKGGLLGRPVEFVVYDDQSNPSTVPGSQRRMWLGTLSRRPLPSASLWSRWVEGKPASRRSPRLWR